ncbi:MAG TPA: ergothioneine biosynthesis glutamate--cysteine ligase EgtA [Jatrophihabitans sp.]|nr:ergothioneine biosynthesis glutamate--cysteine ligase EgtA [Jatrophihabitans sp.]
MTASQQSIATLDEIGGGADPLAAARDAESAQIAAREHVERSALHDTGDGRPAQVGLELEFHLVDLAAPDRRPGWAEVQALVGQLPAMPSGSTVTIEPGGQLELSTPPAVGVAAAVAALRADRTVLRRALAGVGYGTAALGTDPARPPARINPAGRYAAMEKHFAALGCAEPGRAMMTATAALQVNLDAGPRGGWAHRLDGIRDLGPVLVAASACSPLLGARESGWASMRQQSWLGIDPRRSGVVAGADPCAAWASYALDAPVMLLRDPRRPGGVTAVTARVPFGAWVSGAHPFDRPPSLADLDYHLTTLFPPVRPRGYVEIRYLDAVPDRWWPALAALTVTLVDDPVAADRARELCEPLRGEWVRAARDGLRDPEIRAAAAGCADVAARRCPQPLRPEVDALAELIARGRCPGDEVRERAAAAAPSTVLEEEARA